MISTANLSIQFGAKPLFENVSVTFGNGNRYGLIGANGSGKSTLMKILAGELDPTVGNVSTEPNVRVGQLRQDQFAYEDCRVLDTVIIQGTGRRSQARPGDFVNCPGEQDVIHLEHHVPVGWLTAPVGKLVVEDDVVGHGNPVP